MAIWDSQSIQFVWFLTSVEGLKADQLFERLLGEEPDNVQRNKTPGPMNPFFSVASGRVANKQAQLQIQPGRVDLILSGLESPEQSTSGTPPLLQTQNEVLSVLEKMRLSTDPFPASLRHSVVLNLVCQADSPQDAFQIFVRQTGLDFGFPDATDPLLQVNRRKKMHRYDGAMNRLMRFGTANFQQFLFQMVPNVGMPGSAVPITQETYAASLTLDVNTMPDGRTIDSADQVAIFHELAEEALRLAASASPKALADE